MVSTSALAAGGSAVCKGRFINPVTDVCWSCIFPIKLGSAVTLPSPKGTLPDAATNASPICACGRGIKRRVGVNMSYWEPVRTAEIVSEPGCSPTMGGVSFGNPTHAGAGITTAKKAMSDGAHRLTSFYHVHWFVTPWIFLMETLLDSACLETSPLIWLTSRSLTPCGTIHSQVSFSRPKPPFLRTPLRKPPALRIVW